MFESPIPHADPGTKATGWAYLNELEAMADWLAAGPDASPALAEAVHGLDTFRGAETVRRWLHQVTAAHTRRSDSRSSNFLDALVAGRTPTVAASLVPGLENEVDGRFAVLEALCALPDNYRCALLLKEGHGLTVEGTARLMGVSTSSIRSILYRARRALRA